MLLKILHNSHEDICTRISFLIKLEAGALQLYFKSTDFAKHLRTATSPTCSKSSVKLLLNKVSLKYCFLLQTLSKYSPTIKLVQVLYQYLGMLNLCGYKKKKKKTKIFLPVSFQYLYIILFLKSGSLIPKNYVICLIE